MTEYVAKERATPIRQPSTANLMIDSADRTQGANPNNFTINKNNSIMNGFFTRVGLTELVMEWFMPNISPGYYDNTGVLDGLAIVETSPTPVDVDIAAPPGFYTQAELVKWVAQTLTAQTSATWTAAADETGAILTPNGPITLTLSGTIAQKLSIGGTYTNSSIGVFPQDLRLYRYVDIISSQLTANQSLKDASTAPIVRDVLARWYFSFDNSEATDEFGFPILMGYYPFCLRRLFSPPKQIRWENNIPIGILSFQVVDPQGNLAVMYASNWLATLQVSEV